MIQQCVIAELGSFRKNCAALSERGLGSFGAHSLPPRLHLGLTGLPYTVLHSGVGSFGKNRTAWSEEELASFGAHSLPPHLQPQPTGLAYTAD